MPEFIKFWFDRVWESFSRARGIVELGLFILVLLSKQVSAKVVWLCFFVVFIVEVCFVAPYRHAKSIESKLNELTDTKKHEREKRVHECVDATVGILKSDQPLMPFHALSRANAYRLESNDEVVEVCKRIEACGYGHPLRGPRDEWVVPESDWLAFLKRVKYAPGVNPDAKWDYLLEAEKWRNDHGYPEPTAQDRMA